MSRAGGAVSHEPIPAPAPERAKPTTANLESAAAETSVHKLHGFTFLVEDTDPGRRERTAVIAAAIAGQLGLASGQFKIVAGPRGRSFTRAQGAKGLALRDTVWLDPQAAADREVLAHELAHLAQQSLAGRRASLAAWRAEREARNIARAIAEGRFTAHPRIPLAAASPAADSGDIGPLESTVAQTRQEEFERIEKLLSYAVLDWAITDDDVTSVLLVLQDVAFVTARALIRLLDQEYRLRLINNLDTLHYKRFRFEILAAYAGLTGDEIRQFDENLLLNLDLEMLQDEEHFAVRYVLDNLPPQSVTRLRASKQAKVIEAVDKKELHWKEDEAIAEATKEEERHRKARQEADQQFGNEDTVIKKLRDLLSGIVTGGNALEALAIIAQYINQPAKMAGLARKLDDTGHLDRLIDEIPLDSLMNGTQKHSGTGAQFPTRRAFGALLSMRPPYKNSKKAEELVNTHWYSPVDEEDAYLAWLLVQALPPRARESFFRSEQGEVAGLMRSKMSSSMRHAMSMNYYNGGAGNLDRQALLSQLLDDDLWTDKRAMELDGVIRMAIAAGEKQYVFDQFSKRAKDKLPASIQGIVRKYDLSTAAEKPIEGTGFWENSKIRKLFAVIDLIASSREPFRALGGLVGDTIGAPGLNLAELQDVMDGTLLGADLARGYSPKSGVNYADVEWDTYNGVLTFHCTELDINSLNYFLDDTKLQAGTCIVKSLDLTLNYGTAHNDRPMALSLSIGSAVLSDLTWIEPEAMKAVSGVTMNQLDVNAGEGGAAPSAKVSSEARIPLPIFFPLADTLFYILSDQLSKTSPGEMATAFKKPKKPVHLNVQIGALKILGLTTSSGQYIEEVGVDDFQMVGGESPEAYLDALKKSLESIERRIGSEKERAAKATDAVVSAQHEAAVERLEKQREAVRKSIEEFPNRPEAKRGGMIVDAGALRIKGMRGNVTADDITLSHIHGQGASAVGAFGLLMDAKALQKIAPILQGNRPEILSHAEKGDPAFHLDLGSLVVSNLSIRGAVPSVKELREQLDALDKQLQLHPGAKPLLDTKAEIAGQLPDAQEYETLAQIGLPFLVPAQRERFFALRDKFRQLNSLKVRGIGLSGTTLDFQANAPQVTVHADTLAAAGIEGKDWSVDFAAGRNITASAGFAGSLSSKKEVTDALGVWRANLASGALEADYLELEGVHGGGLGADRVTILDAHAGLNLHEGETTVGLKATQIIVEGLNLAAVMQILDAQKTSLEQQGSKRDLTTEEITRNDQVNTYLKAFGRALDEITDAQKELDRVKGTSREAEAHKRLEIANRRIKEWESQLRANRLTIDGLNLEFSASGNLLLGDLDPAKKFSLEGKGPGGQMFRQIALEGAGAEGGKWLNLLTVGATAGRVARDGNLLTAEGFSVDSITASGLSLSAGSTLVWSDGETSIQKIYADAKVTLATDENGKPTWTPELIEIRRFSIDSITASRLGFYNASSKLEVELTQGSILGVFAENYIVRLPKTGGAAIESMVDEEGKPTGKGGVQSLNLSVRAAVEGAFQAGGTLYGSGIKITAIKKDENVISVGDLGLRDGQLDMPGVSVKFSAKDFKGKIFQKGTTLSLAAFKLGEINLKRLSIVDGTRKITSDGPASLVGATITASVDLTSPVHAKISSLHIDKITGDHLAYEDADFILSLDKTAAGHPLELVNINVTDLEWVQKKGITRGLIDVNNAAAKLTAGLGADLSIGTTLAGAGLHLEFLKDGKILAGIDDLTDLSADIAGKDDTGKPYKLQLKTKVHDVKAAVAITKDSITVSPLTIAHINVPSLMFDSASMHVEALQGGSVALKGIDTTITIHKRPLPLKKGDSSIEKITIEKFVITLIEAEGLKVKLKEKDISLTVPMGKKGWISNVRLEKPTSGPDAFTIQPGAGKKWDIAGLVKADQAHIGSLGVDVGTKIKGATVDVTATDLSAEFFFDGTKEFNIAKILMENLSAKLDDTDISFKKDGLIVEGFKRARDGKIVITKVNGKDLKIEATAQNFKVNVGALEIPKPVEWPKDGDIVIPEVVLRKSRFDWDPPTTTWTPPPAGPKTLSPTVESIVDQLSGRITGQIEGTRNVDIALEITNGQVTATSASELRFKLEGNNLVVWIDEVLNPDVLRRELTDSKERERLQKSETIAFKRMLEAEDADPAGTAEEKAKPHADRNKLGNLHVGLSLPAGAKIPLSGGSVELSKNSNLNVSLLPNADRSRMTISMGKVEAGIKALKFGDVTTSIEDITAKDLSADSVLRMNGLEPIGASGTLGEAKATNIKIHIEPTAEEKKK